MTALDEALSDKEDLGGAVSSYTEWDPLEEIIVGTARYARFPPEDGSFYPVAAKGYFPDAASVPGGPLPNQVVEETEEDLATLVALLEKTGVRVRRPDEMNFSEIYTTPFWRASGFFTFCPRDLLLVVGETVIEAPVALRCRQFETAAYRRLLVEYMESGSRWISAPRPLLRDELYVTEKGEEGLGDAEPVFDAANILRLGHDLLYLLSSSGNLKGARWLQRAIGPPFRVHVCHDLYASTHIDSTIMPLDRGLVLLNPSRVSDSNMPEVLRKWDRIWAPEMEDGGFVGPYPFSSMWVGMNVLPIRPRTVIVEESQIPLVRALERNGVECVRLPLRHSRTLGGGFHCATLDIRRGDRVNSAL